MNPKNFFAELKRRNVYKVAIAYGVVAWLLIQIATQVFPFLEIPNWAIRLVIMLLIICFPIALVIAWAFESTPQGIKRTEAADAAGQHSRGGAWVYIVFVGAALSIGLFLLGRYSAPARKPASVEVSDKSIAVLPFENLSEEKGNAYFADGIQEEILTRLAKIRGRLSEEAKSRYVHAYSFALIYLALGDKERAIDQMELAYRERAGQDVFWVKVDPMLDGLRGNPRFEALVQKVFVAKNESSP